MKQYFKNYLIFDLFLLVIAYGTLFNQLARQPIVDWDEGFYATNAIEMVHNGNYLVKYFDGKPEMLAVEPPFVAWTQTFSLKIFGYNEIALRLPSAIAALLLAFLIIKFCHKILKNRILGYFSAFIMLTSPGFISPHLARSADLDSLLVLFTTFYVFNYYYYLSFEKKKYFYFALIGVILAVYTKSIAGLIMILPLFIFTIYKKKLKYIFVNKEVYIGIFLFVLFVGGYYFLRELATPGYLQKVWYYEIAGRYTLPIDGKTGTFLFHYHNLIDYRFIPWFTVLPLAILIIFLRKIKDVGIFLLLISITFWLVISKAATKAATYDAQLYPYLSIIVAYAIFFVYETVGKFFNKIILYYLFIILFIIGVFYYPFITIVNKNIHEDIFREFKYSFVMKKAKETYPNIKSYKIIAIGIQPSVIYYATLFNKSYNYNIKHVNFLKNEGFGVGDTIVFTHPAIYDKLNSEFNYTIIERFEEAALVKVESRK